MKKNVILMGISLMMACLSGCGTTRQITPQEMGNREIQLPCSDAGKDSKEYFSGMGVGENVNMQNARVAAMQSAKQMVQLKIGGMVKGLNEAYSKACQVTFNKTMWLVLTKEILYKLLNVCSTMWRQPARKCIRHLRVHINPI